MIIKEGYVRKFQNSGKISKEKSVWEKLDDFVDTWELPVAAANTAFGVGTVASAPTGVGAVVSGTGYLATGAASAAIDTYQAARNLYKGQYEQAALDGAELLMGLFGMKTAGKLVTTPAKVAAKKATRQATLNSIPTRQKARYIRSHPSGIYITNPKTAQKIALTYSSGYGLASPLIRRNVEESDNTRVVQPVRHKAGGEIKRRFAFKKGSLVKDAEKTNGRDMRKKLVKSDVVTNKKKRITKGQQGLKFAAYKPVEVSIYKPQEVDPFSEFNFPISYKQPVDTQQEPANIVTSMMEPSNILNPKEKDVKEEDITKPASTKQTANHKYTDKNKWVADLKAAYKKAGITNENALRMLIAQDALESGWGKSAQGQFNYGNLTPGRSWKGAVVNGRDSDGKGNPISQKFRSYGSMEEYAADKVQFLKSLYDFDENDDISTFTKKLQGGNKGKRRYAAGANYIQLVTKIYNTSKI